jgi:hypothetical protein
MAVVIAGVFPGADIDAYRQVHRRIAESAPAGLLIHTAGIADGALRVVDVWESPEAFQSFVDTRLGPALAETAMAGAQPDITMWELGNVWAPGAPALAEMDNFALR